MDENCILFGRIIPPCARHANGTINSRYVALDIEPKGGLISTGLPPGILMGDVFNLRLARKKRARQLDAESAAARRLLHGRSKAERKLEGAQRDQSSNNLDGHWLGSGEADEVAGRETIDRNSGAQDERKS